MLSVASIKKSRLAFSVQDFAHTLLLDSWQYILQDYRALPGASVGTKARCQLNVFGNHIVGIALRFMSFIIVEMRISSRSRVFIITEGE